MYECETCQVAKCGSFINDVGRFQNGHKNAIPWDPVDPVKEGKELDLEDYDYEISDDDDEVRNLQTWNTGLIERKGMKNRETSMKPPFIATEISDSPMSDTFQDSACHLSEVQPTVKQMPWDMFYDGAMPKCRHSMASTNHNCCITQDG